MRVIGTAGHVDHGKTALIKALTGMDADRLPEEKARGMTTDLGFAWYQDAGAYPIGVVDVPGHERYLRNMVAGAWGLDLALLVVAADDGWMPQSYLHGAILASLSSPAVILAISKTDIVSPERVLEVAEDSVERADKLFGFRPRIVPVSAKTGSGIPDLKATIHEVLASLASEPAGRGFLYVDRFFIAPGGGLVAAGTLRGGPMSIGDTVEVLPGRSTLKIRGLQSYHTGIETARPNCRAAFALSGIKKELHRGDLLTLADEYPLTAPGRELLVGSEFLCRMDPLPGTKELSSRDSRKRPVLRPGVQVELALGSARRDARFWPLHNSGFTRIVCDQELACPAGFPFVLLRRDGAGLIGRGLVLTEGRTTLRDRQELEELLPLAARAADQLVSSGWGSRNAEALRLCLEIYKKGWAKAPQGLDTSRAQIAGLEAAFIPAPRGPGDSGSGLGKPPGTDSAHRLFLFSPKVWKTSRDALIIRAGRPGVMLKADAQAVAGLQGEPLQALLASMVSQGILIQEGSGWSVPGKSATLTPEEAAVLRRLQAAGKSGLEPGKSTAQGDARILKALCTAGEAVPLEGAIFLARLVWEEATTAILAGRQPGDRFSVPEAKDRSGLSRKYILPLLNRMEDRGFVKRSGNDRVVLKTVS